MKLSLSIYFVCDGGRDNPNPHTTVASFVLLINVQLRQVFNSYITFYLL